jgi:hypothetical protein
MDAQFEMCLACASTATHILHTIKSCPFNIANWSSNKFHPPVWDVCLQLLLIYLIKSSPVQIKSCKLSELISSFIRQYPISLNLWLQSNRGWNRDHRTKLGFKEKVTLRRTLWVVSQRKVLNFRIITREIEMSLDWWSIRNCKVGFCWETAGGNAVRKKDDTWIRS